MRYNLSYCYNGKMLAAHNVLQKYTKFLDFRPLSIRYILIFLLVSKIERSLITIQQEECRKLSTIFIE